MGRARSFGRSDGLGFFCDACDIGQVLRPGRRRLVSDQKFFADHGNWHAIKVALNSSFPCFIKRNCGHGGEKIDSIGWSSKLYYCFRDAKVFRFESQINRNEIVGRSRNQRGIFRRCFNQKINILGEARQSVKSNGMATDQQIFNLPRV